MNKKLLSIRSVPFYTPPPSVLLHCSPVHPNSPAGTKVLSFSAMHLGWVSFSFGRGKKRRMGERGSDSRQKGGGENSCPPLFLFFPPPGPEWVPALIKPSRGGEGPPLPPPEVIRSPSVLPLPSRHLGKVSCPLWPLSACPSLVSFLVSLKRRQLQSGAETKAGGKSQG